MASSFPLKQRATVPCSGNRDDDRYSLSSEPEGMKVWTLVENLPYYISVFVIVNDVSLFIGPSNTVATLPE